MRHFFFVIATCLALAAAAAAAPRQHVLTFGKWMPVKLFVGPDEAKSVDTMECTDTTNNAAIPPRIKANAS